jgi:predicted nuclease with TOPRIM domain
MTIALNDKINTVTIQNNSAPTSFEDIEDAIMEFADGYDLLTFAMPPKELQKRAQESFVKAEEYYANRNARASNLLAAERRYKITIDYLNQFSPKPKIWDVARKRHAEVKAMRHKRWNELQYEVERLERLAKIKEAIDTLNEMQELAPEGSKAHKWARLKITRLSEALKARKK